jgi:hypothetical protein
MTQKQKDLFANNANWDKIHENKFFTGNYSHFLTPRTELDARRNALIKTWHANMQEYIK